MTSRIPKRIIQTGKSLDLPLFSKAAAANVKLLNPDFEYMFFDDNEVENFMAKQPPEYRTIFRSFRFPISRYDFFRYLAIHELGGFYLDLDVFLASGLTPLLDNDCVFPFEELNASLFLRQEYGMDWGVGNYAFGASPGHPFIRAVIENCVRGQKDLEWGEEMMRGIPRIFRYQYYVLNATGPGLIARTLAEYPDTAKQVTVLFPENVCDPDNREKFGAYGVHLMKGTWRKQKGALRNRLYNIWMTWTENKLFKESLKLGQTRSLEFKKKA